MFSPIDVEVLPWAPWTHVPSAHHAQANKHLDWESFVLNLRKWAQVRAFTYHTPIQHCTLARLSTRAVLMTAAHCSWEHHCSNLASSWRS